MTDSHISLIPHVLRQICANIVCTFVQECGVLTPSKTVPAHSVAAHTSYRPLSSSNGGAISIRFEAVRTLSLSQLSLYHHDPTIVQRSQVKRRQLAARSESQQEFHRPSAPGQGYHPEPDMERGRGSWDLTFPVRGGMHHTPRGVVVVFRQNMLRTPALPTSSPSDT